MEIHDSQCDEVSLAQLGEEASKLLAQGDYRALAERFGYALAFDKEPVEAIRIGVEACLSQGIRRSCWLN